MAQCFQRLGSEVSLFVRGKKILDREEEDSVALVEQQLLRDGVKLYLGSKISKVESLPGTKTTEIDIDTHNATSEGVDDSIKVHLKATLPDSDAEISTSVIIDQLLVSTGRKPNVLNMGLEAAKVSQHS